ncbi:cation:proton antiporter [Saccharicrinis sp. FJH62]|uniref:cation:proton antiporter domain-containing protein n=1 Tax=Saccharicrinis sp. FJH62 TaxID=3344657 RepID=UPI0035D47E04
MEFNSYTLIIGASIILVISYFFNLLSSKTRIPSVLMLIILGMLLREGLHMAGYNKINWMPVLEVLGIVGLILIVLEASIDLKLTRKKTKMIMTSFTVAFISFVVNTFLIAFIVQAFIPHIEYIISLVYAMPFSIISSAIVLPSVAHLAEDKKEFLIYESTFSDILGIMAFYLLIENIGETNSAMIGIEVTGNILVTIIISVVVAYALLIGLQKIKKNIKLTLLIAILLLLYSVGKMFHISSLLIILMFGLALANPQIFFRRFFKKHYNPERCSIILNDFKFLTAETAFVVRTFFFVIFGASLAVTSLFHAQVIVLSLISLVVIYGSRWIQFYFVDRKDMYPQVFLAPRGLISVLLFFAIPKELKLPDFEAGILLFIILFSNIIMAFSLVKGDKKDKGAELPASTESEH